MEVSRRVAGKRSSEEVVGAEEAQIRAKRREIAEVCENATELDMNIVEKAFKETPSYENKLQEGAGEAPQHLDGFNTFKASTQLGYSRW